MTKTIGWTVGTIYGTRSFVARKDALRWLAREATRRPDVREFFVKRILANPCRGHVRGDLTNCQETLCGWFGRSE